MSELFKAYSGTELATSARNTRAVLARKQHNPAQIVGSLNNMAKAVTPDSELAITDEVDADVATALASGEIATDLGQAAVAGDYFKVTGAGDTVDSGLAAVKGSAPTAGDVFYCVTATAVEYIGNAA